MYRILIVDDEAYIVQGLIGLIQKTEDLELEVYKAYSASEALNWLDRTKIDIVLSDISMPGVDGLSLQKEIIRLWPRCRIIFLTGYSDFAYVKEAVRHQAVDYILKAEGDDVILRSISQAIRSLDQEFAGANLLQAASDQLQKALPALQKEYLLDVLHGEAKALNHLPAQLDNLQIPLRPEHPVLLVVGKVDDEQKFGGDSDRALLLYAWQNVASELLNDSARHISLVYDRSNVVWLLQPIVGHDGEQTMQEDYKRTVRFVEGCLETIQEHSRRLLRLKVSFAFAKQFVRWEDAAEKFEALQLTLGRSRYLGQEVLLTEDSFQLAMTTGFPQAGIRKLSQQIGLLEGYLESGRRDEFFDLYESLAKDAGEPVPAVRVLVYHRLIVLFVSYMTQEGCYQSLGEKWQLTQLTRYESHGSWVEAMAYFRELAERLFELKAMDAQQQSHHLVAKINQYIEKNLTGDLSLTRIGEWLSLNPYYLSRLYKQLAGTNLTDTIAEARLERARKLLLHTNLKIIDIAAQVGFESNAYFHRVFKKATNLTPHEFRERANSFK
ncbi:response regulator [Paenibacillus cymbidii]|uniref:response regulator n=1 Tax=Paenibacillus cymbidii TaxID=1639034 RepID=UPI00108043EA|nr:response regulator [Paenibacillus cymbidii]